jgi:hypothetical protein
MLTSTYALVAFSVEQADLRKDLLLCRAHARAQFHDDPGGAVACAAVLEQLQRRFAWRKLERFLMPALRQAGRLAEALLGELEALAARAGAIFATLQGRLQRAAASAATWLADVSGTMAQYCDVQLERLGREESELFALARRLVSRDDWFAMARQIMLSEPPRGADRARPAGSSHGAAARPGPGYDRRAAPLTPWIEGQDHGLAAALI